MRIVLNTRSDDAGTRVCIYDLAERLARAGVTVALNDWSGYSNHDVAIFMGYDHELERARKANPELKVVLADPKLSRPEWIAAAASADLLIVSSVEQRDSVLAINRNVHIHHMFPTSRQVERTHVARETTVVAYHGNRVHLEAFVHRAGRALEALAGARPIVFRAIYNIAALGRARLRLEAVTVEHVQWTPGLDTYLVDADIGIVPNELPIRDSENLLRAAELDDAQLGYEPFDHVVRLKSSSNPGRVYPLAQAGLPVVVDFAPSCSQFVRDGISGFVVSSPDGWFDALDRLAASPALRNDMAAALRDTLAVEYESQIPALLTALGGTPLPTVGLGRDRLATAAAAMAEYRRPRAPLAARLRSRLRRDTG